MLPWPRPRKSDVFRPVEEGAHSTAVADARWALTWKMVGGREDAEVGLVTKRYQDPDSKGSVVGTSGCASLRPSH